MSRSAATVCSKRQASTASGSARKRIPRSLGHQQLRRSAGGALWFQRPPQRRHEGPYCAYRTGRRRHPQIVDQPVDRYDATAGDDQPGQHRPVPRSLQGDQVPGTVPGHHRPQHPEHDLHPQPPFSAFRHGSADQMLIRVRQAHDVTRASTEETSHDAVIPGSTTSAIPVADGVRLNVAIGGTGSPIVLLHGFPQTHLMWRHVAADLAADHTVICPDLRGYGASDKPAETDGTDLLQADHGSRHRRPGPRPGPRALRPGRARPRRPRRLPRRPRPPRTDHPPGLPRRAAHPGHVGRDARHHRRRRLPSLPDGPAARPARAADRRQPGRLLRPLPRPLGERPAGDPRRRPRRLSGRLPRTRCRRSSPTTAPPRGSTSTTTRPTAPPATSCACRSPCSNRTGVRRSASTPPRCGAPGRPTCDTPLVTYGHFMAEEAPADIAKALRDLLNR